MSLHLDLISEESSMRSCIPGYICRSLNLVLVYSRLKRG